VVEHTSFQVGSQWVGPFVEVGTVGILAGGFVEVRDS